MPATLEFADYVIFIDDACTPTCTPGDLQFMIEGMVDFEMFDWRPHMGHPLRAVVDGLLRRLPNAVVKQVEIPSNSPDIAF